MTDLKEWIARNANRPLSLAIGTVLCVQVVYLGYLAHNEYTAQLHSIDRVVETASLGIQQDNRPLIEAALLTGLRNADAASVALCHGSEVEVLYPPSAKNPCRVSTGGTLAWMIKREAIGAVGHEFVFIIDRVQTFSPLAIMLGITLILSIAVVSILLRARTRFASEILEPLRQGLNEGRPLSISELDDLRRRNLEYHELIRRQAVSEALFEMSAQVAHDIRSPLAALEVAYRYVTQLPEEKRTLIRSAIGNIRDIANTLLNKNRAITARAQAQSEPGTAPSAVELASPQLLSSLIELLVTEKRLQFRSRAHIEIEAPLDAASYGIFARVETVEFKRLLSNLINNAVEAIVGGSGSIRVKLSAEDGRAIVNIGDNGKGIPPEILAKLGRRGETHGKDGGSGLGLHHARTVIESWGGNLKISSEVNKGTDTTLILPLAPAPQWFVPELTLAPNGVVVILDDDTSIHQIWQGRLESTRVREHAIDIVHFSTPAEIRKWVKDHKDTARGALYLLDYELLGHRETGLSLAEELAIGDRSILVTSRYEEARIVEGCRKLSAKMIPKGLAGLVPVRIETPPTTINPEPEQWDVILIDNDKLTRLMWEVDASTHGKRFKAFSSVTEFLKESPSISKTTPLYIDANLGDDVNGVDESIRINELGFKEIYITTGYDSADYSGLAHIRGVIGKDPPWDVGSSQ